MHVQAAEIQVKRIVVVETVEEASIVEGIAALVAQKKEAETHKAVGKLL